MLTTYFPFPGDKNTTVENDVHQATKSSETSQEAGHLITRTGDVTASSTSTAESHDTTSQKTQGLVSEPAVEGPSPSLQIVSTFDKTEEGPRLFLEQSSLLETEIPSTSKMAESANSPKGQIQKSDALSSPAAVTPRQKQGI